MLSKNAEKIMHNLYKESGEHSWTYSISCESFKAGYLVAQDEAKAEIEKLRAILKSIRRVLACNFNATKDVIELINEIDKALQKDDEVNHGS